MAAIVGLVALSSVGSNAAGGTPFQAEKRPISVHICLATPLQTLSDESFKLGRVASIKAEFPGFLQSRITGHALLDGNEHYREGAGAIAGRAVHEDRPRQLGTLGRNRSTSSGEMPVLAAGMCR